MYVNEETLLVLIFVLITKELMCDTNTMSTYIYLVYLLLVGISAACPVANYCNY